jgi:hypothetical protein
VPENYGAVERVADRHAATGVEKITMCNSDDQVGVEALARVVASAAGGRRKKADTGQQGVK